MLDKNLCVPPSWQFLNHTPRISSLKGQCCQLVIEQLGSKSLRCCNVPGWRSIPLTSRVVSLLLIRNIVRIHEIIAFYFSTLVLGMTEILDHLMRHNNSSPNVSMYI